VGRDAEGSEKAGSRTTTASVSEARPSPTAETGGRSGDRARRARPGPQGRAPRSSCPGLSAPTARQHRVPPTRRVQTDGDRPARSTTAGLAERATGARQSESAPSGDHGSPPAAPRLGDDECAAATAAPTPRPRPADAVALKHLHEGGTAMVNCSQARRSAASASPRLVPAAGVSSIAVSSPRRASPWRSSDAASSRSRATGVPHPAMPW